jgi:hypothetical protein
LSARWTHAEREVLIAQVDRLNHADVSGWSHATSKPFGSVFKPRRPNEDVRLERSPVLFKAISSKGAVLPLTSRQIAWNGDKIHFSPQAEAKSGYALESARAQQADKAVELGMAYDRFYAKRIRKRATPKEQILNAIRPGLLDDCPASNLADIKRTDIPREDEEYVPEAAVNPHRKWRQIGRQWVQ